MKDELLRFFKTGSPSELKNLYMYLFMLSVSSEDVFL